MKYSKDNLIIFILALAILRRIESKQIKSSNNNGMLTAIKTATSINNQGSPTSKVVAGSSHWEYFIEKDINPIKISFAAQAGVNSCYKIEDISIPPLSICFPKIMIIGAPHSGTSYIYQLLSSFPGVTLHNACPDFDAKKGAGIWKYLESLPRMDQTVSESLIVSQCQDVSSVMKLRAMFREPSTHYLVVYRNYPDLLWTLFNVNCKRSNDKSSCDASLPKKTPEYFHKIVESDINGHPIDPSPLSKPFEQPCQHASKAFAELFSISTGNNRTMAVAIEQAESAPIQLVHRIARFVRWDIRNIDLKKMFLIGNIAPGISELDQQQVDLYNQKLFASSEYRSMLNSTRDLLDKCWRSECVRISQLTKYDYVACSINRNSKNELSITQTTRKKSPSKDKTRHSKDNTDNMNSKTALKTTIKSTPSPTLQSTTYNNTNPPQSVTVDNTSESWVLANERGVMRSQSLTITKIINHANPLHSCYMIKCTGNQCPSETPCKGGSRKCGVGNSPVIKVCYPAIIVTGLAYSGVTLMQDVLRNIPGVISFPERDNCPMNRRRPHWMYFNSLPPMENVKGTSIIVDSCSDVNALLEMRRVLRDPITTYIVTIRNYADMLWSMFNTQCKSDFDGGVCGSSHQIDPLKHNRTAQLFDELVTSDKHNDHDRIQPFYPPVAQPCGHAGGVYKEYLKYPFERSGVLSHVVVVSIEQLIQSPIEAVSRIFRRIQYTETAYLDILNTSIIHSWKSDDLQEDYNISNHQPMLDRTRHILDECWHDDCAKMVALTGFNYSACPHALALLKHGINRLTESSVASFSVLKAVELEMDITNKTAEVDFWDLTTQKGIIRGQSLRIMKTTYPGNTLHSCYAIKCSGKHCPIDEPCKGGVNVCGRGESSLINVCYPAVIITGLPKCGTSAMYDLLSRFPGAVLMQEKENCPSVRRRPHWVYFNSLPRMESLNPNSVIIDGCIDVGVNLKMRTLLHNPHVQYIVMIRNYADMLWSSYNFWCKREYDKAPCDYSKWADPVHHIRSPELFHELIEADRNGTYMVQPFYKPMDRPCVYAGGYYSEYLQLHFINNHLLNRTIVIASEELDSNPLKVAQRVASVLQHNISQLDVSQFTKIRVNSQENKGGTQFVSIDKYKPGLYNVSKYRPMLPETRRMLDKCWFVDCMKLNKLTNYSYPACTHSTRTHTF